MLSQKQQLKSNSVTFTLFNYCFLRVFCFLNLGLIIKKKGYFSVLKPVERADFRKGYQSS